MFKTDWKRVPLWGLSWYFGSVLDKKWREDRYSGKWWENIGGDHWQSVPNHQRRQRWWCWQLPTHCRQRCRINYQWRHCSRYIYQHLYHAQDKTLPNERRLKVVNVDKSTLKSKYPHRFKIFKVYNILPKYVLKKCWKGKN